MNHKHAREARIVNRAVGALAKKRDLPVDVGTGATILGNGPGRRHKVPRTVKRHFDALSHKQKGKVSRYWRSGVARSLTARGILPKGSAAMFVVREGQTLSRAKRRQLDRELRAIDPQKPLK